VGYAELTGKYQRLRSELDAAYSGPVWNSRHIDRIAEELSEVEFALASTGHAASGVGDAAAATPALVEPRP
jgi:hypothetical protein